MLVIVIMHRSCARPQQSRDRKNDDEFPATGE
jgi:hypothetical protein